MGAILSIFSQTGFRHATDWHEIESVIPHLTNEARRRRLQEMEVFVLDNSMRESTVGEVRGQTLPEKAIILQEVVKCNLTHMVVGAFTYMKRVDESFAESLRAEPCVQGRHLYAFSEACDTAITGHMAFSLEDVPAGLRKMKQHGITNAILELDLADEKGNWASFPLSRLFELFQLLLDWIFENLSPTARIFINLRDLCESLPRAPGRVLQLVHWLGNLPVSQRPTGLLFEDPTGACLPEEYGGFTWAVRQVMDEAGWVSDGKTQGLLLVHIHKCWGMADASILECFARGADGIWGSLCEEGAAVGHACTTVALMNLVRFGNKYVLERFDCARLAHAARQITAITTGRAVDERQIVYGPRAVEQVFGASKERFGEHQDLDLAVFFGLREPPARISNMATPEMMCRALRRHFGEHDRFTEEAGRAMRQQIELELLADKKEDYSSRLGLAHLFVQATGSPVPAMDPVLEQGRALRAHEFELIEEAYQKFLDASCGQETMSYPRFYHAYMQPYMSSFSSKAAKDWFREIDGRDSGAISWVSWKQWLYWSIREFHQECATTDELYKAIFMHGVLPLAAQAQLERGFSTSRIGAA